MDEQDDYIIIPNPIYDVVFRYLMADLESAKIILQTIMNVKITQLRCLPDALIVHSPTSETSNTETTEQQENTTTTQDNTTFLPQHNAVKDLRLLYIDFSAEIQKENDEKEIVLIELQKARIPSDIYRFRRYIALNMNEKN